MRKISRRLLWTLLFIFTFNGSLYAWQRVTNGLPANPNITRIASDAELAVLSVSSGNPIGIYYSTNGGLNWVKTPGSLPGSSQTANELLVVGNTIYVARTSQSVGTNAILYSTNRGASWIGGTGIPNSTSINLLAYDGSALFAGTANNGNVWRSTNNGGSWEQVSSASGSFGGGTVRALGGSGGRISAATTTGFYWLSGQGTNWQFSTSGGNALLNSRMVWQGGNLFSLYGETGRRALTLADGSTNWVNATNGLPEGSLNLSNYRDLASDRSNTVFASAQLLNPAFAYEGRLFQTTDGGASWSELSRLASSTDVPSIAVISNGLFASMVATPGGLYRVQLVNGQPLFPPQFTLNPSNQAVSVGSTVTFSASASSTVPMTLQWRKDGADLPGETNATLVLPNVQTNQSGPYVLAAWNTGGTNFSSVAALTVIPSSPGWPDLEFQPGFFANESSGLLFSGTVYCLAAWTNGQILVGGQFTHANTQPGTTAGTYAGGVRSHGIIRLNSNGSTDPGFQTTPGVSTNGTVRAIAVAANGKIFVSGNFTNFNGVGRTNLARLNSNGSLDTAFAAVDLLPVSSFGNGIQKLLPLPDGRLVIMGSFTNINGVGRTNIASLNPDGSVDTTWPGGSGVTYTTAVSDIGLNDTGDVLLAGAFPSFNGTTRRYLVASGTNGIVNTNFNHTLNNPVNEVELQPGGLIWATGTFAQFTNNGVAVPVVKPVRLSADGVVVSSSPTNLNNPQYLLSQEDGAMITSFYNSTEARYQLMRFTALGAIDESFETAEGFNSSLSGMVMTPSGDLYVVGFFSTASGVPVQGLAKIFAASTNVPLPSPIFTLSPSSSNYASNATVTLRAAAVGAAPLAFTWFQDGTPVSTGTNVLVLSNFNSTVAGAYQVVVSNIFGSVTSAVANLTLGLPPEIIQQPPASAGTTNGGTITIPVGVSGTEPISFQWYQNNNSSFGRTNNPLVISNFSSGLAGGWKLVASNLYGKATSAVVTLQIGTAPSIFTQPNNQNVFGTGNATMVVGASGTAPLSFQWYQNGSPLAGFTTNSFTITNALPPNAGQYYLQISNFAGMVTSLTRTVTVVNPFIASGPASRSAPVGSTTNLSIQVNGTVPITYSWYHRIFGTNPATNLITSGASSNLVFVDLARTNAGSYFVVTSNVWGSVTSSLASLTVQFPPAITNIPVTSLEVEIGQSAYAPVLFEAQPNPTYSWFKDNVYQPSLFGSALQFNSAQETNSGSYQLVLSNYLGSVTSSPIVLTVKPPRAPTITDQPDSDSTAVGQWFILNVTADGTPTMQYRWFRDGTPVTSFQPFGQFYVAAATTNDAGDYTVVVTNSLGSVTSSVATITVVVPQTATVAGKQFVRIADSTMQIPGLGTNRFSGFNSAFIVNGEVWFGGGVANVPFSGGVYHWSNSVIESLVNTNAAIPGGSGTFSNFYGSTFLSDGKVIFAGRGSSDQNGLYAWTNGTIIKLYDKNTTMPGRAHTFENFGWPTVVGNQFAFLGFQDFGNTNFNDDYRAVYISSNNVLTKLADTNDILPDVGFFRGSSSQVAFDGNKVAWWGVGETGQGIFTVSRTAPISAAANSVNINPASGAVFDGFISPPDSVPGRTYFVGHDTGFNTALFYHDVGGIHLIAKPSDIAPGRGLGFRSVGYPSFAASPNGLFYDGLSGNTYGGIFYWDGTNSTKIIDSFDTLENLGIQYVYVADADSDAMVFYVGFLNGKQALYALMPATGQSFSQWASGYSFPPGESDPEDDPDDDGVKNIFEFYFGGNPLLAASGNTPAGSSINVSGQTYPAITFVRVKNTSGVTLAPQASSNVNFSNSLGIVVESLVDLGNGTERVTIRSATSDSAQATQFLRIQLFVP